MTIMTVKTLSMPSGMGWSLVWFADCLDWDVSAVLSDFYVVSSFVV